jgi:hypothetical protein
LIPPNRKSILNSKETIKTDITLNNPSSYRLVKHPASFIQSNQMDSTISSSSRNVNKLLESHYGLNSSKSRNTKAINRNNSNNKYCLLKNCNIFKSENISEKPVINKTIVVDSVSPGLKGKVIKENKKDIFNFSSSTKVIKKINFLNK